MNNRVFKNAGWIIGCKIVQSILSLVIGLITARYLGPSNYGIISYVASVVAFAAPIMQLGLRNTLVKEFVKYPNQEGKILGTALFINIISSVFCIIGSVAFVMFLNAGETETIIVCALYSLILLFQATEITQYWFQAKLLSKYPSIASLCAYIIVALYKIYLLVTQKNIRWFALSNVLDFFLISVILLVIYKKLGGQQLSVNWQIAKELLSRSKYYIIPSLMVIIFQHTDRIMIKLMVGEAETGFYSAAITCIAITSFVFDAVIDSARPVILEAKEKNQKLYETRMIQLYSIITCMSLAQSIGMTLLARPLVLLLYGVEYVKTASILAVAVWYITFSHYGSVRNIWILAESKQKYLTGINVAGAIANVVVNFCLIPILGAVGAALASLVTQFFTNVIIGFILKPIRYNNYLMVKSLSPKVIINILSRRVDIIKNNKPQKSNDYFIITAGSTYLDIDAYACCVAMSELLQLKGKNAIAYSKAPVNYSVSQSLIKAGQIAKELSDGVLTENTKYIIVDVSDPEYITDSVPLEQVVSVYDHHVGFENYWQERVGDNAHIEFIGAAATLIYREWKKAGLQDKMSVSTAKLLIAAILDNTLNLTASNITAEDIECFNELCAKADIGKDWCVSYFSEVQASVEADLKNSLFKDLKIIRNNMVLPPRMAQICVWNSSSILERLPEIRCWFAEDSDSWMINIIDLSGRCSYFVCDDENFQKEIASLFNIEFKYGVAKTSASYLRKEIIRKTIHNK